MRTRHFRHSDHSAPTLLWWKPDSRRHTKPYEQPAFEQDSFSLFLRFLCWKVGKLQKWRKKYLLSYRSNLLHSHKAPQAKSNLGKYLLKQKKKPEGSKLFNFYAFVKSENIKGGSMWWFAHAVERKALFHTEAVSAISFRERFYSESNFFQVSLSLSLPPPNVCVCVTSQVAR